MQVSGVGVLRKKTEPERGGAVSGSREVRWRWCCRWCVAGVIELTVDEACVVIRFPRNLCACGSQGDYQDCENRDCSCWCRRWHCDCNLADFALSHSQKAQCVDPETRNE